MELVALSSDVGALHAVVALTGGRFHEAYATEKPTAPYRAMLRTSTDAIEAISAAADVGLYVAHERVIKAPGASSSPDRVIACFGMVAHPDLGHRGSDDHWRDRHAPLALKSHLAMCDYTQLSIVATLQGTPLDGIALCAFDSRQELSDKFFNDDAAKADIIADVSIFADTRASLPRVVLAETPLS